MIKKATPNDIDTIVRFIHELAVYEKMQDQVTLDKKTLNKWIFEKKTARVYLALDEEKPVGFMLYFYNFSTFLGKPGIYIEDIYIQEKYRNLGYGKALFNTIVQQAKQEEIDRIEWSCLNWNTPSIAFYKKIGAKSMDDWTKFRLNPCEYNLKNH